MNIFAILKNVGKIKEYVKSVKDGIVAVKAVLQEVEDQAKAFDKLELVKKAITVIDLIQSKLDSVLKVLGVGSAILPLSTEDTNTKLDKAISNLK